MSQTEDSHKRYLVLRNCRDPPSLPVDLACAGLELLRIVQRALGLQSRFAAAARRVEPMFSNGSERDPANLDDPETQAESFPSLLHSESAASALQKRSLNCNGAPISIASGSGSSFEHPSRQRQQSTLAWGSGKVQAIVNDFEPDANAVPDRDIRVVLEHQLRNTMIGSGSRGRSTRDRLLEEAVAQAAAGCVWDTSHPFAAALCKPWLPATLCFLVVVLCLNLLMTALMIADDNAVVGRRFRFTALQRRDGGKPLRVGSAGIAAFGIINRRSCLINGPPDLKQLTTGQNLSFYNSSVDTFEDGATVTITFPAPTIMTGWWFQTVDGPSNADPVRFTLEASTDLDVDTWTTVGASEVLWTWAGTLAFRTGLHSTREERGTFERFDTSLPWPWSVPHVLATLCYLIMCLLLLVASVTQNQMCCGKVCAATTYAGHLIHLLQCIACSAVGQVRDPPSQSIHIINCCHGIRCDHLSR